MLVLPAVIRLLIPKEGVITLSLEEYLRGVVPWEVGPDAPLEAMRAQAVAARSYAAAAALDWPRHQVEGADVCATTHCQFWGRSRNALGDEAVASTAGEVLVYQGRVVTAFYHRSCGGRTLSPAEAGWYDTQAPWCQPVACPCGRPRTDHGVGLCQYGARFLATQGENYRDILLHYYAGVELVRVA